LDDVLSSLLRTFGRVKGKDYVRKLMSRSKASLLAGTRPGLAVTSLNARVKKEKEQRKDMVAAEEETFVSICHSFLSVVQSKLILAQVSFI
jgi:hypothetical protein